MGNRIYHFCFCKLAETEHIRFLPPHVCVKGKNIWRDSPSQVSPIHGRKRTDSSKSSIMHPFTLGEAPWENTFVLLTHDTHPRFSPEETSNFFPFHKSADCRSSLFLSSPRTPDKPQIAKSVSKKKGGGGGEASPGARSDFPPNCDTR